MKISLQETAFKITLSSILTAETFNHFQLTRNVEICGHDVIEKCVGYSGKVCVSCVRAVVR